VTDEPTFLALNEVLAIHRDQIERYGGSPGVRDRGLLDSALAAPQATFDGKYLHHDIVSMAAAYLLHLAQNHPFIDGNKRVAAVATVIFLDLNGLEIVADENEFEALVLEVAQGESSKEAIATFLRTNARPVASGDA
jgi:death-on-curing protein